jgi:hypothetical protein
MLTIPSGFSSNLSEPSLFIVRMTVVDAGTTNFLYMSSLPLGGYEVLYSGAVVAPSASYIGARIEGPAGSAEDVQGIGEVDISLDIQGGGNISGQGETTLVFLNQGGLMSSEAYDLENQAVEIWELHLPPSDFDIATSGILRFRGIMRNAAEYDATRWTVKVVDRRVVDTRPLPRTKLNLDTFPNLPGDAVGRVSQIVIGSFGLYTDDFPFGVGAGLPAIPAHMVDPNLLQFAVAEHSVSALSAVVFKDSSGLVGEVVSGAAGDVLTGPSTFNLTDGNSRFVPSVQFDILPTVQGYLSTGSAPASWRNAIDGDQATAATIVGGGSGVNLLFTFNGYNVQAALRALSPGFYDVAVVYDWWNKTGSPRCLFGRRSIGTTTDGTVLSTSQHSEQLLFQTYLGTTRSGYNVGGEFGWDALLNDLEFGLKVPAGASIDLYGVWLRVLAVPSNLGRRSAQNTRALTARTFGHTRAAENFFASMNAQKVVAAVKENPVNVLAGVQGPVYTSAMTSGRTHGWTTSDVIENPGHAIEWILRDRLGLATADLDVASFDAVGHKTTGTRAAWKLATALNRQVDAFEFIREICFEFGLLFFVSNSGKYKLASMDSRTEDLTLDSGDIAFDPANGPLASLSVTPNDAISNDLYANYAVDYQSNEATLDVYLSDVDGDGTMETNLSADSGSPWGGSFSDFVNDSRTRYRSAKALQVTLEHIRDAATAEAALKKLASWVCFQRLIFKASLVRNTDTLRIEPGDVLKLNLDLLPSAHKNVTKFLVSRVNYPGVSVAGGSPYLNIEAEEIPNSNTGLPVTTSRYISSADLSVV